MPAIIRALLVPLLDLAQALWLWVIRSCWPSILRFFNYLGLASFIKYVGAFIGIQVAQGVINVGIRSVVLFAMLGAWAALLFVVFNISILGTVKEAISGNIFSDIHYLWGAMYLSSHVIPYRFLFGCLFSLLIWRISLIQAALIFNRTIIFLNAGVKF